MPKGVKRNYCWTHLVPCSWDGGQTWARGYPCDHATAQTTCHGTIQGGRLYRLTADHRLGYYSLRGYIYYTDLAARLMPDWRERIKDTS